MAESFQACLPKIVDQFLVQSPCVCVFGVGLEKAETAEQQYKVSIVTKSCKNVHGKCKHEEMLINMQIGNSN